MSLNTAPTTRVLIFSQARVQVLALLLFSRALAADLPPAGGKAPEEAFRNPIGDPPIHLQDPFILVHAKKYFLFGTASPSEGFQCYESSDLAQWKLDGWAWRKSGMRVAKGQFHSPQAFEYQTMFYLVYSARTPSGVRMALAASIRPEGPYHDVHVPWLDLGDGCTDGSVFIDSNSKAYLTFTRKTITNNCYYGAIYGVALSKDLSKTQGQPVKLLEVDQRWELVRKDLNRCNESPRMIKIASKYYLTYSANDRLSADYGIGYAMAAKPLGPWTKSSTNPLLSSHAELGVLGPGHGAVFQSVAPYEWFIVYDNLTDPANRSEDHLVNIDRVALQADRSLTTKGPTRPSSPPAADVK